MSFFVLYITCFVTYKYAGGHRDSHQTKKLVLFSVCEDKEIYLGINT